MPAEPVAPAAQIRAVETGDGVASELVVDGEPVRVGQTRVRRRRRWTVTGIARQPDNSAWAAQHGQLGKRTGPWKVWMSADDDPGVSIAFDPERAARTFKAAD